MNNNNALIKTAAVASVATLGTMALMRLLEKRRIKKAPKWELVGYVSKIYIYPMKSGQGLELQEALCTRKGLQEIAENEDRDALMDRSLVIYKDLLKEPVQMNAINIPKALRIKITATGEGFILEAPGMEDLHVRKPEEGTAERKEISVYGYYFISLLDCGEEASRWLTAYILGQESEARLKLGLKEKAMKRNVKNVYRSFMKNVRNFYKLSWDVILESSALHFVNEASISDMNSKLENGIPVTRFRPNLVVSGKDNAYEEDDWELIKIGEEVAAAKLVPCVRCALMTIDPEDGVMDKTMEPLKTLRKYRFFDIGYKSGPVMGIRAKIIADGIIKVGDPIYGSRFVR